MLFRKYSPQAPASRGPSAIEPLEARQHLYAVAGSIDATKTRQTIDSLGAASIAWKHIPEQQGAGFYDQLVNDLGASGVRGAISPNFELANDNADPNVFDWTKFDSKQLAHVMQFNQRMKERGVKSFFLSVWTPPHWMKTNRSTIGGGSLRADMRAEFAEYLAAVAISSKRDFGIELSAISLQNEQFFPAPFESAMYDNAMLRETLVAVQAKFAREKLTTKIIVNEDLGSPDFARWKWFNQPILDDDEIDRSRLIIGSHWTQPSVMAEQAAQIAGTGLPLWYTEVSGKAGDWSGGIKTARELSETLTRAEASAFYYWVYNDTTTATPAGQTPTLMGNGAPNGKYDALKHFYKYIRPGMRRLETTIDETTGTRLSAFQDPKTKATTVVLINESGSNNTVTLDLKGLGAGTAPFRGFRSSETETWASMGNLNLSGSTAQLTVPRVGIVTLYNGPEIAPVTGAGSPQLPIYQYLDAVQASTLRRAALLGNVAEVTRLISGGANANTADPVTGWTALHAAASGVYMGSEEIVNQLIAAGANVNAKDVDGFTPLHAAAMNQMMEYQVGPSVKANVVKKLIESGASVDAKDNAGRTALMWSALAPATSTKAFANYLTEVPSMLLTKGANRTLRDNAGRTAYDYAVQEYKAPIAQLLTGANTDTHGPEARYAKYSADLNRVSLVITENGTATLDAGDVRVVNRATNATVSVSAFTETFSTGLTIARASFANRLPDGHYRLTIAAGAFADQNGVASKAISLDFDVMRGDTNGDGRVDFTDLVTLGQNYGQAGRSFSHGDFTGDGRVTFEDLVILGQRYGTSLPAVTQLVTAELPARGDGKR